MRSNQFGNAIHGGADRDAVVAQDDQARPAVADVVRYVERSSGKHRGLEHLAAEDLANPVVQLHARFFRVDVLLLPPDDLRQIGLGKEAQRRAPDDRREIR